MSVFLLLTHSVFSVIFEKQRNNCLSACFVSKGILCWVPVTILYNDLVLVAVSLKQDALFVNLEQLRNSSLIEHLRS